MRALLWTAIAAVLVLVAPRLQAAEESAPIDRAVVRFIAPDLGGPRSPQFVFERLLAFEARLQALADTSHNARTAGPFLPRHVRGALERIIGETLLASRRIDPEPTAGEVTQQVEAARLMLLQRIGGDRVLRRAAEAEQVERRELLVILRRRAMASLYLDRMVTPMLQASDRELQRAQLAAPMALRERPFQEVREQLARWWVGRELSAAVVEFFQSARARLRVTLLD